jgi:hypothetical protein
MEQKVPKVGNLNWQRIETNLLCLLCAIDFFSEEFWQ